MALLPEKRESRRETAFEIVYRQDWPSEEKAYHLYQLHNAEIVPQRQSAGFH